MPMPKEAPKLPWGYKTRGKSVRLAKKREKHAKQREYEEGLREMDQQHFRFDVAPRRERGFRRQQASGYQTQNRAGGMYRMENHR